MKGIEKAGSPSRTRTTARGYIGTSRWPDLVTN